MAFTFVTSAQPLIATSAFLRIDADDDPARELLAGLLHEGGVLDGRGAEDDPVDADRDEGLDRGHVADAAADLDRDLDGGPDRLDGVEVLRHAGKGAVQVDDMQEFGALRLPVLCRGRGVVGVDRGLVHEPLFEADAFAFF